MPVDFSWAELGVDGARVSEIVDAPLGSDGREFVLYWCMVNQRAEQNHALDAAIAIANRLELPVVCYQALRPDYPYASDRLHAFVLEAIPELTAALKRLRIPHWVELPHSPKEHRPRIAELGRRAAAVVSDLFPTFIIPGHLRGAARALDVPLYAVDASCLVPMQRIPERQVGAYALRPKLRKLWPEYLGKELPVRRPKHSGLALKPGFPLSDAGDERAHLENFAIDHSVPPVTTTRGGRKAGLARLRAFVRDGLPRFASERSDPSAHANSALSAYLHWGQLWTGEIAQAAIDARGVRDESVQEFLEELLVRRELGFNYCLHTDQKRQLSFESLPPWARQTLDAHRKDRRQVVAREVLEQARTGDPLWNAAQRELLRDGRIHNYLRMLWGKRILEWSKSPEEALATIASLNDKYALDGRDPVSVANFMWILGLHDRPFQERPVMGKVRPMSSSRTAQKFDLSAYLAEFGST